jgi:hypothetical protein
MAEKTARVHIVATVDGQRHTFDTVPVTADVARQLAAEAAAAGATAQITTAQPPTTTEGA